MQNFFNIDICNYFLLQYEFCTVFMKAWNKFYNHVDFLVMHLMYVHL